MSRSLLLNKPSALNDSSLEERNVITEVLKTIGVKTISQAWGHVINGVCIQGSGVLEN